MTAMWTLYPCGCVANWSRDGRVHRAWTRLIQNHRDNILVWPLNFISNETRKTDLIKWTTPSTDNEREAGARHNLPQTLKTNWRGFFFYALGSFNFYFDIKLINDWELLQFFGSMVWLIILGFTSRLVTLLWNSFSPWSPSQPLFGSSRNASRPLWERNCDWLECGSGLNSR